jgi:hypothetical protein
MEIFVSEPGRFADALTVHQAETAMERRRRWAGFLEQIGVGPIAHALGQTLRALELAQDIGRADIAVVNEVARV